MATKVSAEMKWDEYVQHTLNSAATNKLSKYTAGKVWKLPAPYTHRTTKKEGSILAEVKGILTRGQVWFQRIDVSGKLISGGTMIQSPMVGMPDIIALLEGVFFAIELKASGGTVSSVQMNKLLDIRAAGGTSLIVVDPTNLLRYMQGLAEPTCELNGLHVL